MTSLILLGFSPIFSFADFNLNYFYLHLIKEIEFSNSNGNQSFKNFDESKIQKLIYNINIIFFIRSIIIEEKNEKEEEKLILKHLETLMQLKEKYSIYYFDELKNFPTQEFKTMLYLNMKKTAQLIKFRVLLNSTRDFIEYHEYLESHLSKTSSNLYQIFIYFIFNSPQFFSFLLNNKKNKINYN